MKLLNSVLLLLGEEMADTYALSIVVFILHFHSFHSSGIICLFLDVRNIEFSA